MLLGEGGPHERGGEIGAGTPSPLKRRYSTVIGSSNVKIGTDMLHIMATSFLGMSTSMTLNDLEPPK